MITSKAAKAKGVERNQYIDTSSLMEQVLSKDNLNAAYLQVVRNKGTAGVDEMTVEEPSVYLSENGEIIKRQLRSRKYRPQPVRRVEIPKPDGGIRTPRVLTVVHCFARQAVAHVLTPIFEEQFHGYSYGFGSNIWSFFSGIMWWYTHDRKDLQEMKCITSEYTVIYYGKWQMNVLTSIVVFIVEEYLCLSYNKFNNNRGEWIN